MARTLTSPRRSPVRGTLKNQIGGAPVQVAVLSSELYLDQLKEKGLISSDWRKNPNNGAVIKSVIVFVTRKGNPKGLATFEDLVRPGTKVLHASPDTSGGAQWAIFAIYERGRTSGTSLSGRRTEA